MTWSPLLSTIIDSSVWRESKETKIVWITILAKKDRNGFVRSALWALARDAGVTEDECREAIRVLESPDPESNTKAEEGRRIRKVDGGWLVINHFLHRDRISKEYRKAYQREWQREYRKRRKAGVREANHEGGCAGAQAAINAGFNDPEPMNGNGDMRTP